GFAAFAGLAIIAEPAVRVMVGPDWIGAAEILPLLCIAGAVNALVSIQESYVLAINKLRRFLAAAAIEAAIGVLLIGVAGTFGLAAVAVAVVVRTIIAFYLRTRVVLTAESISWPRYMSKLGTPLVVSAGMASAVGIWYQFINGRSGDAFVVATSIALGIGCFLALVLILMPGTATRLVGLVRGRR
ncbi:MAG: hypothetical protein HKN98_10420, partial [Silicimonas sp.]|nr:hypothetical protein [Silicimonas sp.]